MKKLVIFIALFFVASFQPTFSQGHYSKGCKVDSAKYESVPRVKEQTSRSYEILPSSHSIKAFCPEVKNQSSYSTCVGWATAYAARTIADAIQHRTRNRIDITRDAFSPLFVYSSIKKTWDEECQVGTSIEDALLFMKRKGCLKYSRMNDLCVDKIDSGYLREASVYRLDNYRRLFDWRCSVLDKVYSVRKSIFDNRPVVVSMWVPESFEEDDEIYWISSPNDSRPQSDKDRWHAMCVVAYDDSFDNDRGAFLLMNSWGQKWGDMGFKWIPYDVFGEFVRGAFEVYMNPLPNPPATDPQEPMSNVVLEPDEPTPVPVHPNVEPPIVNHFLGKLTLKLSTGETMEMMKKEVEGTAAFHAREACIPGLRYRIYLDNNEPAWVYVLSSDSKNMTTTLFPPNERISAELSYSKNSIAIPDETYFIETTRNPGQDYLCVLFSVEELDVKEVMKKVKNGEGSFYKRVIQSLGNKVCSGKDIKFDESGISFSAMSSRSIVPIFIEMDVRD